MTFLGLLRTLRLHRFLVWVQLLVSLDCHEAVQVSRRTQHARVLEQITIQESWKEHGNNNICYIPITPHCAESLSDTKKGGHVGLQKAIAYGKQTRPRVCPELLVAKAQDISHSTCFDVQSLVLVVEFPVRTSRYYESWTLKSLYSLCLFLGS